MVSQHRFFQYFRIPTEYLIVPSFYLFVCHYLGKEGYLKKSKYLLIVPFFIGLLGNFLISVIYHFKISSDASLLMAHAFADEVFSNIWSLGVIIAIFLLIKNYKKEHLGKIGIANISWLFKILIVGFGLCNTPHYLDQNILGFS